MMMFMVQNLYLRVAEAGEKQERRMVSSVVEMKMNLALFKRQTQ